MPLPTAAGEEEGHILYLEYLVNRFGLQQMLTWMKTVCDRKSVWVTERAHSALTSSQIGHTGTATSGTVAWTSAGTLCTLNLSSFKVS